MVLCHWCIQSPILSPRAVQITTHHTFYDPLVSNTYITIHRFTIYTPWKSNMAAEKNMFSFCADYVYNITLTESSVKHINIMLMDII